MNIRTTLRRSVIFYVLSLLCVPGAHSEGLKGRFGIGGFGGEGIPLGMSRLTDQTDVGSGAGGTIRYGLSKNWAMSASYENIYLQNGVRREPLTLSALYYHHPEKHWTPVGEFGVGAAASTPSGPFTNFSLKAGIGAEVFLTRMFAIGPQLNFHYISDTGKAPFPAVVMVPGVIALLYFGGDESPATAAAPATIPVMTLVPAQVALDPGQVQQFQAKGEPSVGWSIQPALGTISEAGLYTAPAEIAFPESVQITAISRADASRTASSVVQLKPPATAPQEVSIRLEILFDTGKDVVKPDFDRELKKLADFLKSYSHTTAQIEGHTDNTGGTNFNKLLSQRRADSVKNALISRLGIEASRLTAVGYGPDKPIADNTSAEGRAKNRRVVAVVKTTVQP